MSKKKGSFFKDFKDFISRGNILDMAVGVIIGGAFGKIVSSLVADIITPLISLITGGVNLAEKYVVLNTPEALKDAAAPETATAAKEAGYAIMTYGNFIQTIIDFLIIALSIFIFLRIIVKSKAKLEAKKLAEAEAKAAEEAAKAEEEKKKAEEAAAALAARQAELEESALRQTKLLEEIRDLMKNK